LPAHSLTCPHSVFTSRNYCDWRDAMSVLYVPTLSASASLDQFHASVDGYMVGDLTLNRCRSVGQAFGRSAAQIGRDGIESYMVQVFLKGRCHAHTTRGDVVMSEGDICMFDNAEPLDTYNEDFDLLALVVPRERLAPLLHNPDGTHYGCIKADEPLAKLFGSHLQQIYNSLPSMRKDQASDVLRSLVPFLAAVVNCGLDMERDQREAVRQSMRRTIRQYVDANLSSPDLRAESLAVRFGMSRATLYRLFEAQGGPGDYIQQRRLAAARNRLVVPASRLDTINAIAASVGFQSESSFIRSFRRRFGVTPGDIRKGHHVIGDLHSGSVHERSWADWLTII